MASSSRRTTGGAIASLRSSRSFRYLWMSNVLFFGGVWTQTLVLGWMVFEVTGSPLLIAVFTACRLAPMLLGPFAGVIADRFDRYRVLVIANVWALVAVVALAVLAMLGAAPYPVLLVGGLVIGLAQSPSQPARSSLVVDTVPRQDLSNANALNSFAMNMTQMIGPAVGGALIGLVGAPSALAVSASWFAVSLAALVPVRGIGRGRRGPEASAWRMLIDGLGTIGRRRVAVAALAVTFAANILIWPVYQTFMPVFAGDVLDLDAAGLGALMTCAGLGGTIGSLLIASLGDFPRKGAVFLAGTASWGVLWAAFALSSAATLSFPLMVAAGLASAPFGVLQTTLVLLATPARVHGTALGLQELAIGVMPIATLGLGALAEQIGVPATTFLSAAALVVSVIAIALAVPALLRYDGRHEPDAEPAAVGEPVPEL
ncbi:MFS transporter [Microbacterium mangrovi]|uniref:MFS transporter n=1 Tax=Microbacterium mangrovi TaxID=1348253 RepID=UPI00068D5A61|nr:MFS transporter [Microbacterium mangrovi]